jgi:2-polyprenyl-3-methyl-5-hydroxy-6-metoxy-1,4-benzoquinol methylase
VNKEPDFTYREIINEYYKIYWAESSGGKLYGKSSEDLLEWITPYIKELNPKTILDWGCGRSCLVNYFWKDGERKIYKYDPAIHEYKDKPEIVADLLLCTDVLEHIPKEHLALCFQEIFKHSRKQIFTVSMIKARKKLPCGMNAHVNVQNRTYWVKEFKRYFDNVQVLKEDDNMIAVMTETKPHIHR